MNTVVLRNDNFFVLKNKNKSWYWENVSNPNDKNAILYNTRDKALFSIVGKYETEELDDKQLCQRIALYNSNEITIEFKLRLNIKQWGSVKKGDIMTYYIRVFDERNGLVRFPIDKHWDIVSHKVISVE